MRTPKQQKFIDALRSGEYKQGKGYLVRRTETDNEYCCWGVCAVVNDFYIELPQYDGGSVCSIFGNENALPLSIVESLGFINKIQQYMMAMNDGVAYGKRSENAPCRDFKFIARFLEIILPKR